ncbi:MAG: hypothetical protein ACK4YP_04650 [Myxococcota bacterium]
MDLLDAFQEGGAAMYAVLALDVCAAFFVPLALVAAIVARFQPKVRTVALVLGGVAVFASVVPMCAGVGGYLWGMQQVEAALQNVDPEMRDTLQAVGEAEASNNLTFGFGSGCLCLVPAIVALLLVPAKPVVYDDV